MLNEFKEHSWFRNRGTSDSYGAKLKEEIAGCPENDNLSKELTAVIEDEKQIQISIIGSESHLTDKSEMRLLKRLSERS